MEQKFIKIVRTENIAGVDVSFVYEYLESEKPEIISATFQKPWTSEGVSNHASYNGSYNFKQESVNHQLYNAKMVDFIVVLTGIESIYAEIVNSFNL